MGVGGGGGGARGRIDTPSGKTACVICFIPLEHGSTLKQ